MKRHSAIVTLAASALAIGVFSKAAAQAGIIRFGDIIVAEAVRSGRLVPLMENFQQPETFPLWAIFQRRRQRTPRVKAFLDFLMERFAGAPWRAGST